MTTTAETILERLRSIQDPKARALAAQQVIHEVPGIRDLALLEYRADESYPQEERSYRAIAGLVGLSKSAIAHILK